MRSERGKGQKMTINELAQLLKISESSIEASKLAIAAISKLHISYCEIFRNEIDNIWHKQDGRYKMCGKFVQATQQFETLVAIEREKNKKTGTK